MFPLVATAWEGYLVRRTLLMSDFVRVGAELDVEYFTEHHDVDVREVGQSLSWRSENLKSVLASLLLIDLATILDEALEGILSDKPAPAKGHKGKTLEKRLLHADALGLLLDHRGLDELRRVRNRVAHERHTLRWVELRGHEFSVRRQLLAWGIVDDAGDFNATLSVGAWEARPASWERSIWVGADDAAGKRAWGYAITESASRGDGITRPEDARVGSLSESEVQWYKLLSADDPDAPRAGTVGSADP